MFIFIPLLYFVASACISSCEGYNKLNVITVPPNCPPGQQLVNGVCRPVWNSVTAAPVNVITVPTNCPPGQEYINGQCREVWWPAASEQNADGEINQGLIDSKNVISTPGNCRPGQQLVNGQCRDVWMLYGDSRNVIEVPPNCPPGQELVNGKCREIWRSSSNTDAFFENFMNILSRKVRQIDDTEYADFLGTRTRDDINVRNIVNVPNQCPAGWRPDALGICRPILPSNTENISFNNLRNILARNKEYNTDSFGTSDGINVQNIVTVPNQCPAGYRPDALGICRPML